MSNTLGDKTSTFPRRLLFEALHNITTRRYDPYLSAPFEDALQQRLHITGAVDTEAYLDYLASNDEEGRILERRALVGVTQFFRDSEEFAALSDHIQDLLVATSGRAQPLQIWVPACSTGQEAYSLAILLRELSAEHTRTPSARIVASDINAEAIEFARAGCFRRRQLHSLDVDYRDRYFRGEGEHWQVAEALRQSLWFFVHDVLDPAPFDELDIISCRNLLIYLRPAYQHRILRTFARTLRPGGLLFLGASETTISDCDHFHQPHPHHRIYVLKS